MTRESDRNVEEAGDDPTRDSASAGIRDASTIRLTVPLLLAAGWGALFCYSAMFLSDTTPPETLASLQARQSTADLTAFGGPSEPGRPAGGTPPGSGWQDPVRSPALASVAADLSLASRRLAFTSVAPESDRPSAIVPLERADYVGIWGPSAAACGARSRRRGFLPATITLDGAKAGRTICNFRDSRRSGESWLMAADCSDRGRRWSSQVRLIVDGDRLTWSSAKGSSSYVRCGRR